MIKINSHDAETHLSGYPEIWLLASQLVRRRPIGLAAATFSVPEIFCDP